MAAFAAAATLWAAGAPARADPASRAQWHPLAAAHLYAVFAGVLEPVDWRGIAARYAAVAPEFPHAGAEPAYAALERLAPFAGRDPGAAVRAAVEARDPAALGAASARALSVAVRERLDRARTVLNRPASARRPVLEAQSVYRGLEGGLRAGDPDAHRRLGLLWLQLTTALGGASVDTRRAGAAIDRLAAALQARFETGAPPLPSPGAPWLPPDGVVGEQAPLPRLVLNFEERGVDERRLFLVAYGDLLFDSPLLFGGPARDLGIACSSCHNRGDVNRTFYIPGLSRRPGGVDVDGGFFNPAANDHRFDPLDIPSLRGVRFTAPYGRDGRTASLREFVRGVVVHEFAGAEPTPLMLDALVAYMNEFDFLPAPLLYRDGRLNARAGAAARRGEAIFNRPFPSMGGRSCAACHIPDAHFLDGRRHDIGSAVPSSTHARDTAFDTPTLLGILYTAPYFHDGALPTLADVVDWFNRRYALGLDAASAADLTAYLEAVGAGERPFESFDAENTRARLGFAEASVFLSTLDRLIPARDRRHALLALRSVGADLAADAAGMATPDARTAAAALASRISALARAVDDGDWREAARLWAEYREAEARHADRIH